MSLDLSGFHLHFLTVVIELSIGCRLGNAGAQLRIESPVGDTFTRDNLLAYLGLAVLVGTHEICIGLYVHAQIIK